MLSAKIATMTSGIVLLVVAILVPVYVGALSPCMGPNCERVLYEGDLITSDAHAAVYLFTGNERRPFPTGDVYKTYYTDYTNIKKVSTAQMEEISLGMPVSVNPGLTYDDVKLKLVKFPFNPKTYYVEKGSVLRHIENEQLAIELFGKNWNKKVITLPEIYSLFYTKGLMLNQARLNTIEFSIKNTSTKSSITEVLVKVADTTQNEAVVKGQTIAVLSPKGVVNTMVNQYVDFDSTNPITLIVTRDSGKKIEKTVDLKSMWAGTVLLTVADEEMTVEVISSVVPEYVKTPTASS